MGMRERVDHGTNTEGEQCLGCGWGAAVAVSGPVP